MSSRKGQRLYRSMSVPPDAFIHIAWPSKKCKAKWMWSGTLRKSFFASGGLCNLCGKRNESSTTLDVNFCTELTHIWVINSLRWGSDLQAPKQPEDIIFWANTSKMTVVNLIHSLRWHSATCMSEGRTKVFKNLHTVVQGAFYAYLRLYLLCKLDSSMPKITYMCVCLFANRTIYVNRQQKTGSPQQST